MKKQTTICPSTHNDCIHILAMPAFLLLTCCNSSSCSMVYKWVPVLSEKVSANKRQIMQPVAWLHALLTTVVSVSSTCCHLLCDFSFVCAVLFQNAMHQLAQTEVLWRASGTESCAYLCVAASLCSSFWLIFSFRLLRTGSYSAASCSYMVFLYIFWLFIFSSVGNIFSV